MCNAMVKGKLVDLAPMDRSDGEGQVLTPVVACKKICKHMDIDVAF
jgi:hypothetical protein